LKWSKTRENQQSSNHLNKLLMHITEEALKYDTYLWTGNLSALEIHGGSGYKLNTTAWDEHVPEIERYIQTVKERISATTSTLPFEQLPHRLIVEIAFNAVFWLDCFPHKEGIHSTLSPCTIVTGSKIDFNKHCRLQFGTYIQMHEQHNNSLLPRMAGAIELHPTGNKQAVITSLAYTQEKD